MQLVQTSHELNEVLIREPVIHDCCFKENAPRTNPFRCLFDRSLSSPSTNTKIFRTQLGTAHVHITHDTFFSALTASGLRLRQRAGNNTIAVPVLGYYLLGHLQKLSQIIYILHLATPESGDDDSYIGRYKYDSSPLVRTHTLPYI